MKMKMKRKSISLLLMLMLVLTMCLGTMENAFAASYDQVKAAWEKTGDYLYNTVKTPANGVTGGEWFMYGLAEAKYNMPKSYVDGYRKTVEAALEEGYRGVKGILHDKKYTEYSRVIIAYSALGLDPTDINGHNMVAMLADFDKVVWQGINGPIFALRALDAGGYEIPKMTAEEQKERGIKNLASRRKYIDYLLENQLPDGGWALGGNVSDSDLTAMGLESLAPHYKQKKVKAAIEKAIKCLSEMQDADGGFSSWGTPTLESAAQVVSALSNVGINADKDKRFRKNGKSVLDAIMTYYDDEGEDEGGFRHVNQAGGGFEPVVNQMATEQAYYALAQYYENIPATLSQVRVSSPKGKMVKVSWENQPKADGFQIKVAFDKGFSKTVKTAYVKGNSYKINLSSIGKTGTKGTCYVKVRAYKVVNGRKAYGAYSYVKTVA